MEQDVKERLIDITNSLRKITYQDCVERPALVMVDAKYASEVFDEFIASLDDYQPIRHGYWTHKYYPTVWYGSGEPPEWVCSECEDRAYNTHDWCPNCGSKMDGEHE